MDWQFKVGIGVAVVFGLLPFAIKDMPQPLTWAGALIGLRRDFSDLELDQSFEGSLQVSRASLCTALAYLGQ